MEAIKQEENQEEKQVDEEKVALKKVKYRLVRQELALWKPLPDIFKIWAFCTVSGGIIGGAIGSIQRNNTPIYHGAVRIGMYASISSMAYLGARLILHHPEIPPANSSLFAGLFSGFIFGVLFSSRRWSSSSTIIRNTTLTGAFLGYTLSIANSMLDRYKEQKKISAQDKQQKRKEQFLKDKELYGDKAYEIQHRDAESWLPSWFPFRRLSDEEYQQRTEEREERKRLERFIREKKEAKLREKREKKDEPQDSKSL